MSLMRWPVYAWSNGEVMHLWIREDSELSENDYGALNTDDFPDFRVGIHMRQDVFDEIAVQAYQNLQNWAPKYLKRIERKLAKERAS